MPPPGKPFCYICRERARSPVEPCSCKGETRTTCRACIERWIETQPICRICGQAYAIPPESWWFQAQRLLLTTLSRTITPSAMLGIPGWFAGWTRHGWAQTSRLLRFILYWIGRSAIAILITTAFLYYTVYSPMHNLMETRRIMDATMSEKMRHKSNEVEGIIYTTQEKIRRSMHYALEDLWKELFRRDPWAKYLSEKEILRGPPPGWMYDNDSLQSIYVSCVDPPSPSLKSTPICVGISPGYRQSIVRGWSQADLESLSKYAKVLREMHEVSNEANMALMRARIANTELRKKL